MTLIAGLALMVAAAAAFCGSLPRNGKTARFVGTEWEGYVVVLMIGILGIGAIMTITGVTELVNGA